ncbi:MAG: hypothetical protein KGJ07_05205 [Patescibacteria group bacterium]|nr:hypothetical protein [Patescibacteria group bacterium]
MPAATINGFHPEGIDSGTAGALIELFGAVAAADETCDIVEDIDVLVAIEYSLKIAIHIRKPSEKVVLIYTTKTKHSNTKLKVIHIKVQHEVKILYIEPGKIPNAHALIYTCI